MEDLVVNLIQENEMGDYEILIQYRTGIQITIIHVHLIPATISITLSLYCAVIRPATFLIKFNFQNRLIFYALYSLLVYDAL